MTPVLPRLRDIDVAETMARFRAFAWTVGACLPLAVAVALYLQETRQIGGLAMLGVLLGGVVVGVGLGGIVLIGSQLVGRGVAHVVTAAGNLEPNRSYSYQESLLARGRPTEAADAYAAHLAEHPDDHDARIALAELRATHLADPGGAERLYLEVRAGKPSPRQERVVSDGLINLHHKTGQRGREMAELARLADRYRGTPAGDAAKRVLEELKQDTGSG